MIGFVAGNVWWLLPLVVIAVAVVAPAAVWRLRWPLALALVAIAAAVFWLDANSLRQVLAERDRAEAVAGFKTVIDVRATEQAGAESVSQIGVAHEQDRLAAEDVPDAVAAAVHAGDLRLRQQWAGCETRLLSATAAAAASGDASAASGAEAAGRVVRIGRDADDQLQACQATLIEYRAIANGELQP
ncbi:MULTISPECIES: hypothetical protein [Luteimonas]|uniref:hypothetical protein n=1 Tax=Luteimonas TaxID=83614 RepID=UPI0013043C5F|nr:MULTISPECIES: hypothetical protein [Luteimonas]